MILRPKLQKRQICLFLLHSERTPNVQGSITTYTGIDTQFYTESVDAVTFQGALKNTEGTYNCYAVAGATTSTIPVPKDLTFNAAWSNSLYSDSSKVQPSAFQALMIIKN